jgi:hypothetical protein
MIVAPRMPMAGKVCHISTKPREYPTILYRYTSISGHVEPGS